MKTVLRAVPVVVLWVLMLNSAAAWSYEMRVDRFEVLGPTGVAFIDEFGDGLPGGWTNFNGLQTFGTWEEEQGTGFARLSSPGLTVPGLPGLPAGLVERSDIFSYRIPDSVVSGGSFSGVVTLDSALPADGQVFFLSLNYFRPGVATLLDNVFVMLGSVTSEQAASAGLQGPGLYLYEGHIHFGPLLGIVSVTDTDVAFVPQPPSPQPLQLRVGYEPSGSSGEFTMSYRFGLVDAFVAPLAPIAASVSLGHWDIGTARTVPEPSVPPLLLAGLAGVLVLRRPRVALGSPARP